MFKKTLSIILLAAATVSGFGQGTKLRVTPTTTALSRSLLQLESPTDWAVGLGLTNLLSLTNLTVGGTLTNNTTGWSATSTNAQTAGTATNSPAGPLLSAANHAATDFDTFGSASTQAAAAVAYAAAASNSVINSNLTWMSLSNATYRAAFDTAGAAITAATAATNAAGIAGGTMAYSPTNWWEGRTNGLTRNAGNTVAVGINGSHVEVFNPSSSYAPLDFDGTHALFTGDGSGLTNLPTSTFGINVLTLGVKGGTNDDTVALQAIASTPGTYFFPATNYTCGSITFGSNVTWIGTAGSRIDFLPGLTGKTMLNFLQPQPSYVTLQGLYFCGTNFGATYSGIRSTNDMRVCARPNVDGGITFDKCRIGGFDFGIIPWGVADGLVVQTLQRFTMTGSEVFSNSYGALCLTTNASFVVEYIRWDNNNFFDNSRAFYINSGNINVTDSTVSHNYIAFELEGGAPNSGHGLISGNSVNHCALAPLRATGITSGFVFRNNLVYAGDDFYLWDSKLIEIVGNTFDVGAHIWAGDGGTHGPGGPNYVVANSYKGKYGVFGDGLFLYNYGVGPGMDQTTNLVHWDNYSTTLFGDVDPYSSNPFAATNYSTTVSANGYTNVTMRPQILNVQGASGTYVFYTRSTVAGGTNLASIPIWTNTITSSGSPFTVGGNNGVQIVTGSGVHIQVSDQ